MIYKPNKPDIDLIRDFTNANPRKQSTPNITLYPGAPGPSCSSGGGLKYAHGTFGSLTQLNRNLYSPASTSAGPSPSAYRRNSSLASFSSYAGADGIGAGSSGNNTNTNGNDTVGCYGTSSNASKTCLTGSTNLPGSSTTSSSSAAVGGTARKVRIRIQKNPGAATDKYVELHSVSLYYFTVHMCIQQPTKSLFFTHFQIMANGIGFSMQHIHTPFTLLSPPSTPHSRKRVD